MPKVSIKPLGTVLNTIDVVIDKETHTAASVIVEKLNDDPMCEYAAYKVDHPRDDFVSIRIKGRGSVNPREILRNSVVSLLSDIEDLIAQTRKHRG